MDKASWQLPVAPPAPPIASWSMHTRHKQVLKCQKTASQPTTRLSFNTATSSSPKCTSRKTLTLERSWRMTKMRSYWIKKSVHPQVHHAFPSRLARQQLLLISNSRLSRNAGQPLRTDLSIDRLRTKFFITINISYNLWHLRKFLLILNSFKLFSILLTKQIKG